MHGQTFSLNENCWITGFGKTKETDGEWQRRQALDACLHVWLHVHVGVGVMSIDVMWQSTDECLFL